MGIHSPDCVSLRSLICIVPIQSQLIPGGRLLNRRLRPSELSIKQILMAVFPLRLLNGLLDNLAL